MDTDVVVGDKSIKIKDMVVPQLQAALRERKLSTKGKRKDLVDRLIAAMGATPVVAAPEVSTSPDKILPEEGPKVEPVSTPVEATAISTKVNDIVPDNENTSDSEDATMVEDAISVEDTITSVAPDVFLVDALPATSSIEYDDNAETITRDKLIGLALNTTDLSFSDLGMISPYAAKLYESDDFWYMRYTWRYGYSAQKPAGVSWRVYGMLSKSSAYVYSPSGTFHEIERVAWRSFALLKERVTTDNTNDVPKELEIDTDVIRNPNGVTYIGRVNDQLVVSFRALDPAKFASQYGLSDVRSVSVYDLDVDDILSVDDVPLPDAKIDLLPTTEIN